MISWKVSILFLSGLLVDFPIEFLVFSTGNSRFCIATLAREKSCSTARPQIQQSPEAHPQSLSSDLGDMCFSGYLLSDAHTAGPDNSDAEHVARIDDAQADSCAH